MSQDLNDTKRIGKVSPLIPSRTHTYALNNLFYATIPAPYKQYYQRHVRDYFMWYDGYVDWFHNHNSGVFSTRIAYTILHKLAKQTTGNRLLFDDEGTPDLKTIKVDNTEKNSLQFIEWWSEQNCLSSKATQATEWAFAGGDSLLKLDSDGRKLFPSAIRKDNYVIDTDFKGNVVSASMLIYTYTDMESRTKNEDTDLFFILEERRFNSKNEPEWRLNIKRGTGSNLTYKDVTFYEGDINFRDLKRNVREKLVKEFPNTIFGQWEKLPFKSLGLYLVKSTEKVSFAPSFPFGESLLSNNIAALMSYDFYYSSFNTDMYMGRGKVLMPKHIQSPHLDSEDDHFVGYDNFLLTQIPYVNPENQKPLPIQFDLRSDDWEKVRNIILQTISTNIGISERTIATYLVPASEKPTAYEISSDENATALFVEEKREYIKKALNSMIIDVLDFHNFGDEKVYVKFSKVGLTNINNIINQVTILKQNDLIDDRTALEMVFPDKTEKQIDNILQGIKERQERNASLKQSNQEMENKTVEDKQTQNFKDEMSMRQTK